MISVFTPTYNRANKLIRVFESLTTQTFTNFEWVVIDDGSEDNIIELINEFKIKASFKIIFHKFQSNKGKHNATNKALELANGEFFIVADSDDGFKKDALEYFINGWNSLPEIEKENFCGIRACCEDQYGNRVSDLLENEPLDATMAEAFYVHKFRKESWTMVLTEWHRQYLFPPNHIDNFYPEGIIWKAMSKTKKLRFFNKATRIYYVENENSLMRTKLPAFKKVDRTLVNVIDIINNDICYFSNYPLFFFKSLLLFYCYVFYSNGYKHIGKLSFSSIAITSFFLPFGIISHIIFRFYNLFR